MGKPNLIVDDFDTSIAVKRTRWDRDVWFIAHSLLAFITIAILTLVVPKFEAIFKDFGLPPSGVARVLFVTSHFLTTYWYAAFLLLVEAGVLDVLILDRIEIGKRRRGRRSAWGRGVAIALGSVMALSIVGLIVPLITLVSKLSG